PVLLTKMRHSKRLLPTRNTATFLMQFLSDTRRSCMKQPDIFFCFGYCTFYIGKQMLAIIWAKSLEYFWCCYGAFVLPLSLSKKVRADLKVLWAFSLPGNG